MFFLRTTIVLCVLITVSVAAAWYWRSRPERVRVGAVRTGEIVVDDFGFNTLSSTSVDSLGPPDRPVLPRGRFVVVSVRINNHAKRVEYRFEPRIAQLLAPSGEEFGWSPEGQAALDASRALPPARTEPIPPGASCDAEVVFDVPRDADGLLFRVSFLPGILGAVDVALYGEQRLRIE